MTAAQWIAFALALPVAVFFAMGQESYEQEGCR